MEFQIGNIYDLSFEDGDFNVDISSAVAENLSNPVHALREIYWRTKSGGIGAVIRAERSFPLIVP